MTNHLKIIKEDSIKPPFETARPNYAGSKARRMETQAYFERKWLLEPEKMDPLRNCMERERLKRTLELLKEKTTIAGKKAVDLGCGGGVFSRMLQDEGASIDAVDIAQNALKIVNNHVHTNIQTHQDYVPSTKLGDDAYDIVICTELIAELQSDEYRLLISELVRLVKPEGWIVCSTSIDINSVDALQRFAELAEAEINIDKWRFSHHRCYIRLCDFLEAPAKFVKASRQHAYKMQQLNERSFLSRFWFRLNSATLPAALWYLVTFLSVPLTNWIKQSDRVLLGLEKMCTLLWSDAGITQAIFVGKRRPLFTPLPEKERPVETKHKRQVWE